MIVVGLVGHSQSGKDVVADAMVKGMAEHDPNHVAALKVGFSDAIMEVATILGWDGDRDGAGRLFLQDIGTAIHNVDSDAWLNPVHRAIEDAYTTRSGVVVTGVRRQSEADFLTSQHNTTLVRVTRPGCGARNGHSVESEIDGIACNYEIVNNDSLRVLIARAYDTLETIVNPF